MAPTESTLSQHQRRLGRVLVFAAVVIIVFGAADPFSYPESALKLALVRFIWGGSYLACAWWLSRGSSIAVERVRCGIAVGTPVAFAVFLSLCGAVPNAGFSWLLALPFALVLLLRSTLAQAIACSVTTLAVALGLLAMSGAAAKEILQWALSLLTSGVLASWAAHYSGRLRHQALVAEEARARAQESLREAELRNAERERLALVGQLAAGVAHEINNPLATVRANLAYLEGEGDAASPEERAEVLGESSRATERIARIVQALRVYADTSEGEPTKVQLEQAMARAVALVAAKTGCDPATVSFMDEALPAVHTDETKLVHALVEVLDNAVAATRGTTAPVPCVHATVRHEGGRVLLDIDDEGPGFTQVALARAGTPFFTTKGPGRGTGLGLAGAKEELAHIGAAISFSNRIDGGARVTLSLPSAKPG